MSVEIRRTTVDEINASGLTVEYAAEPSIKELPSGMVQIEQYKMLEESGLIYPIGAYLRNLLIGFVGVLTPVMPHYGVKVAYTESFFVSKEYRKSGAGLKLLRAAEEYARETGCVGLLVSSPFNGDLAQVLPRVGYSETNVMFYKHV